MSVTLRVRGACLVALAIQMLAAPAAAEELVVRLDPAKTKIAFTLAATLHTVRGTARMSAGEVRFDPGTGAATGRIAVDATSAATGNQGRDADLHAKVLESGRFPEIVLAVERVEGGFRPDGPSRVTVHGQLTIHGGTHPVALPAEVSVEGGRLTATLAFSVPYVEWGMKDPSKFLLSVAKEVKVTVEAEGTIEP